VAGDGCRHARGSVPVWQHPGRRGWWWDPRHPTPRPRPPSASQRGDMAAPSNAKPTPSLPPAALPQLKKVFSGSDPPSARRRRGAVPAGQGSFCPRPHLRREAGTENPTEQEHRRGEPSLPAPESCACQVPPSPQQKKKQMFGWNTSVQAGRLFKLSLFSPTLKNYFFGGFF